MIKTWIRDDEECIWTFYCMRVGLPVWLDYEYSTISWVLASSNFQLCKHNLEWTWSRTTCVIEILSLKCRQGNVLYGKFIGWKLMGGDEYNRDKSSRSIRVTWEIYLLNFLTSKIELLYPIIHCVPRRVNKLTFVLTKWSHSLHKFA